MSMKLRKVKTVPLNCPAGRSNCNVCPFNNGTEQGKVYCYYGDPNWIK